VSGDRFAHRPAAPRLLLVVIAAAALLALTGWLTGTALVGWRTVLDGDARLFEPLVAAAAATVAAVIGWWLTLSVSVSTAYLLRGLPRPAVSARVVHRLVAVALGVGLTAGALPATAATPTPPSVSWTVQGWGTAAPSAPPSADAATAPSSGPAAASPTVPTSGSPTEPAAGPTTVAPSSGWLPTPPPVPDVVVGGTRPPVTDAPSEASVVVVRGDSLWRIAAEHLGPQASDAEIAEAWPAWYAANADVIGDDPDLIYPGQELRVP
jgi:LysM repeat protein